MKRLPKGFGSVYKLSGNRRRPYAVRVRSGSDKNGKPTYSILGYFATSEEALTVLTEYNKNPYDLKNDSVTIADMWEIFKKSVGSVKFLPAVAVFIPQLISI